MRSLDELLAINPDVTLSDIITENKDEVGQALLRDDDVARDKCSEKQNGTNGNDC